MKKPALLIAILTSFFPIISEAEEEAIVYSIEYASNSPLKNVPLQNADLNLQIFADGNPRGFLDVKTDENSSFTLKEKSVFEVISIKGEETFNARCSGYATPNHTKISISCVKRK